MGKAQETRYNIVVPQREAALEPVGYCPSVKASAMMIPATQLRCSVTARWESRDDGSKEAFGQAISGRVCTARPGCVLLPAPFETTAAKRVQEQTHAPLLCFRKGFLAAGTEAASGDRQTQGPLKGPVQHSVPLLTLPDVEHHQRLSSKQ